MKVAIFSVLLDNWLCSATVVCMLRSAVSLRLLLLRYRCWFLCYYRCCCDNRFHCHCRTCFWRLCLARPLLTDVCVAIVRKLPPTLWRDVPQQQRSECRFRIAVQTNPPPEQNMSNAACPSGPLCTSDSLPMLSPSWFLFYSQRRRHLMCLTPARRVGHAVNM